MTPEERTEALLCLTTDQLEGLVESVDPDWADHFPGDLDRAVSFYADADEFRDALTKLLEEIADNA